MLTILELTRNNDNEKITVIANNIQMIAPSKLFLNASNIFFNEEDSVSVKETREEITAMLRGDVAKEPQQKKQSILDNKIESLELNLRTINILNSKGINTIRDLMSKTGQELEAFGIGKRSRLDIEVLLGNIARFLL